MSVKDGIGRSYDWESGEMKMDNFYVDGVRHGKQMTRMSSNTGGYFKYETYDNGKLVGEYLEVTLDKKIRTKGKYNTNGKRDGEWIMRDSFPDKSGTYSGKRVVYKNGEVVDKDEVKDFDKKYNR